MTDINMWLADQKLGRAANKEQANATKAAEAEAGKHMHHTSMLGQSGMVIPRTWGAFPVPLLESTVISTANDLAVKSERLPT